MTDMRKRLIELINSYPCMSTAEDCFLESISDDLANYLISNGVISPPCRVGDTVYYITGLRNTLIKPAKIEEIIIGEDEIKDLFVTGNGCDFENSFDIFFLTHEEAEKALKERKND